MPKKINRLVVLITGVIISWQILLLPCILLLHFLLFQEGLALHLLPEEKKYQIEFSTEEYKALKIYQGHKYPEMVYQGIMHDIVSVKRNDKSGKVNLIIVKDGWDKHIKKIVRQSQSEEKKSSLSSLIGKLCKLTLTDERLAIKTEAIQLAFVLSFPHHLTKLCNNYIGLNYPPPEYL